MGRWAQRRRTGGGAASQEDLIYMVTATVTSSLVITVSYNKAVSSGDLDPTKFVTNEVLVPDSVEQVDATTVEVVFLDNISATSFLTWSGIVTNVVTPQTIPVS